MSTELADTKQIFEQAKGEISKTLGSSVKYNTNYMLPFEAIHAASILQISKKLGISLKDAATKYLVKPIEISADAIGVNIIEFYKDFIDETSKHIKTTNNPSFFSFCDGHHYVTIGLIPDQSEKSGVSVLYVNSEKKANNLKDVGKDFCKILARHLNEKNDFIDKSTQQQYDNCCGLSTASNIADTVACYNKNKNIDHLSFSIPNTPEEQKNYYQQFGSQLFNNIKNYETLDYNAIPPRASAEDKELIEDLVNIFASSNSKIIVAINSLEILSDIVSQLGEHQVTEIIRKNNKISDIPKEYKKVPDSDLDNYILLQRSLEQFSKKYPTLHKILAQKMNSATKQSFTDNTLRGPNNDSGRNR